MFPVGGRSGVAVESVLDLHVLSVVGDDALLDLGGHLGSRICGKRSGRGDEQRQQLRVLMASPREFEAL